MPLRGAGARDPAHKVRYWLERISQISEQDADASEVHEAEEVVCVALMANDESPVVLQPGKQALNLSTALVAAQATTVLCDRPLPVDAVT